MISHWYQKTILSEECLILVLLFEYKIQIERAHCSVSNFYINKMFNRFLSIYVPNCIKIGFTNYLFEYAFKIVSPIFFNVLYLAQKE